MRILMVSEDVPHHSMGGLGRHALTLARNLASAGHVVDFMGNNLITYDEVQHDIELPGKFFPDLNMKGTGWKETQMGIYNPLRRPYIAWRFAHAISRKAQSYDVVHYHGHFPLVASFVPKRVNFVQTRHDQGSDCLANVRFRNHDVCTEISAFSCASCASTRPNLVQKGVSASAVWVYRKLVARAFRRHKTIFVSNMLQRNFSRVAGQCNWGKVVNNFVDCSSLRNYVGAPESFSEGIQVFIAGKLSESKGIRAFLEIIHPVLPDAMRIAIAGDGKDEADLRKQFGRERIDLLGWQTYSQTMRGMGAANIVVVPSIWEEPCATTVLEALALGKTTFALNRGGTPELKQYEQYPGQLQLFDSLRDLVASLISFKPVQVDLPNNKEPIKADISFLLSSILQIYATNRV